MSRSLRAGIAVSGATGFIGSHLVLALARMGAPDVTPVDRGAFADVETLTKVAATHDAFVHLSARNRGAAAEVHDVNVSLARDLVAALHRSGHRPHVLFASSTQATGDTPYGRAKRAGEQDLADWSARSGAPLTVLRIPNVYGPGARPFHNSVVATFCHQLARGRRPRLHEDRELGLVYVGDLVARIAELLADPPTGVRRIDLPPTDTLRVSKILAILRGHAEAFADGARVPAAASTLERRLRATFLAAVPYPDLATRPAVRADERGSLFEAVRHDAGGQVFLSTTRPGVVRGNHYHVRKTEKFCVLQGEALVRLRRVGSAETTEYGLSGERPTVVDIPVLHTHNIENVGGGELRTLFWADEVFDPGDADTYPEAV
ncbi:MAG: NAD-dependent epimerase/dehydratase family protein [Actinomycetota bacterium]|nr:NAD-dependent epimerase/dehydratase family protein [Actinomycetota bacterium]